MAWICNLAERYLRGCSGDGSAYDDNGGHCGNAHSDHDHDGAEDDIDNDDDFYDKKYNANDVGAIVVMKMR